MIFPKMGRNHPPNSKIADRTTQTVFWKTHPGKLQKWMSFLKIGLLHDREIQFQTKIGWVFQKTVCVTDQKLNFRKKLDDFFQDSPIRAKFSISVNFTLIDESWKTHPNFVMKFQFFTWIISNSAAGFLVSHIPVISKYFNTCSSFLVSSFITL